MGRLDGADQALIAPHRLVPVARRAAIASGAACLMLFGSAHVGSPDTFWEGKAGPYAVRVIIRSPQVIPAQAELVLRVAGSGVARVTATARIWNGGARGAPPPDDARRVTGDSTLWTLPMWIMRQGSYAVLVHVDGAMGPGDATVPYTAVASAVLKMDPMLGIALAALGVFLVAGLVTIAGAATREATLAPGLAPDAAAERRVLRVRGITLAVIVVLLALGRLWWNAEDRAYKRSVFRPGAIAVSTRAEKGRHLVRLVIDSLSQQNRGWIPLIPDHGKLMHLFLVKEGDLGALAHLHPVASDALAFEAVLPPLPAGRYHLYADVVHESGFAETMVGELALEGSTDAWKPSDSDDAAYTGGAGTPARFDDGSTLAWTGAGRPLAAGDEASLSFALHDARGAPLPIDPYLGMAAHAVVVRDDGSVYVHLHPLGTASMGAERALRAWTPADSVRGSIRRKLEADTVMATMTPAAVMGEFGFPYAFPKAGRYRVWVQFRSGHGIRTAAFDAQVGGRGTAAGQR